MENGLTQDTYRKSKVVYHINIENSIKLKNSEQDGHNGPLSLHWLIRKISICHIPILCHWF